MEKRRHRPLADLLTRRFRVQSGLKV